jgi:4'-phosphopantetheinyl transferase
MLEVFAVNLENYLEDLELTEMLPLVSKEKQNQAQRFLKKEDAYRAVIGELLIRKMACEKLKVKNSKLEFEKNQYGKPFLKEYPNFYFNISHSGNWIVSAVDDRSVGIDVEKIAPIDLKIAKRYFSKEEYRDLMAKKEENRLSYFYDLWTLKESYIKAVGKGLSLALDSFTVKKLSNRRINLKVEAGLQEYFLRMYDIDEGYKLAVCACNNCFPSKIIKKEATNFLELEEEIRHLI